MSDKQIKCIYQGASSLGNWFQFWLFIYFIFIHTVLGKENMKYAKWSIFSHLHKLEQENTTYHPSGVWKYKTSLGAD